MNSPDRFQAARLQALNPNVKAMVDRLPDLGESIRNAAGDLAKLCTVDRCDQLLARLKTAETSVTYLRRSLAQKAGPQL